MGEGEREGERASNVRRSSKHVARAIAALLLFTAVDFCPLKKAVQMNNRYKVESKMSEFQYGKKTGPIAEEYREAWEADQEK